MSHRLKIALTNCSAATPVLEPVAARFGAVADVRLYTACTDGSDVDSVRPALREANLDAVVALPKPAARLMKDGVPVPVVPLEMPADVVLGRAGAALQEATSVAILPPAGTVPPATIRLLRRLGGAIHVFPYETHAHLRDLVVRCRRMGVEALVGGESLLSYAGQEGLRAVSLVDRPDETAGVMGQAVVTAARQVAPNHGRQADDLARLGVVLEKIAQGAIGPRDAILCVDRRGRVTAAFTPPAASGGGRRPALALPAGLSVMEAVAASAAHAAGAAGGDAGPVALDIYPLADGAGDGYLVVLRGSARPAAAFAGDPAGVDAAGARVARLLERVEALLERTDARTRARRARHAPRRFLASLRRRTFLLDWRRVRYFELRSGLVYATLAPGETYATNYTLSEIAARVDPRDFFRIHRNVLVNLRYVTEVERYGQGHLRVLIEGPEGQAFVASRPASAVLRKLLKF